MQITFKLNGHPVSVDVEPRTSLADVIRAPAQNCTSVHLGCEHGVCGACTVSIDGKVQRSCIALAVACEGAEVITLEGYCDDPLVDDLKRAFHENHGLQCGFCTPGMVVTAREIIIEGIPADEDEIRQAMSGNICRCTGYTGIVDAILEVSRKHQG